MTENAIVKMAAKIRNKVGTTKTFNLPEIAILTGVLDHFPDFNPTVTLKVNGATQQIGSNLNVHGGDIISFTYSYTITHPTLLRKLVSSNANLALSISVINYMENFSSKATAQTIHVLKKDGSNLISPTTIPDGTTQYAYSSLQLEQPLTSDLCNYLCTNQPIEIKYDNIGSHADLSLYPNNAVNLLLFK